MLSKLGKSFQNDRKLNPWQRQGLSVIRSDAVGWNRPWIDENLLLLCRKIIVWQFCDNMYIIIRTCCHRKSPTGECVIDASVGKRTCQPQIRRNTRAQWQWNTYKLQIQRMPSFLRDNWDICAIVYLKRTISIHFQTERQKTSDERPYI